ncbi:STAS domain-containing protein [Streptomyces sp. Edi2]|uniref:STAS domain-containing protein n=1 Tax=Streptomyces TaxID=1883 RepID=UPI003306462A|nr:STAS domain-containing protein [Streptomyces platensis]
MPDDFPAHEHHEHRGLPWSDSRLLHPFRHRGGGATSSPDHVIVRLPREVTVENAERIRKNLQKVLSSGPAVLEVDLSRVTHLDSVGGAVFITASRLAWQHGTRVIATHAGSQVRRALGQLGLRRVIDVYEGSDPGRAPGRRSGGGEQ